MDGGCWTLDVPQREGSPQVAHSELFATGHPLLVVLPLLGTAHVRRDPRAVAPEQSSPFTPGCTRAGEPVKRGSSKGDTGTKSHLVLKGHPILNRPCGRHPCGTNTGWHFSSFQSAEEGQQLQRAQQKVYSNQIYFNQVFCMSFAWLGCPAASLTFKQQNAAASMDPPPCSVS